MFTKVLIANRGEIACRIMRTLKKMNIQSVAVYSEADANSLHVSFADEAVLLGPPPAAQSYLNVEKILAAARQTGVQAIHPGYGFLSENPAFAETCSAAGIVFIGPTPDQMRAFGLKHTARRLAQQAGVPLLPGTPLLQDIAEARAAADRIGYPVMLKSTAGGGGIGMRLIRSEAELAEAYDAVQRLAANNFKDAGVYLEKFVESARHIEVQIFGDGKNTVLALGERDCSAQRRNQKVIEETPAPNLPAPLRQSLHTDAVKLTQSMGYQSAGTVEFVYDALAEQHYFLEVNTRLQVEHGVTEEVTGVDLVQWMIQQAAGELDLSSYPLRSSSSNSQHSIQVRLYAEDPNKNFQPSSGRLTEMTFPQNARIETWVEPGSEISPYYDPLIAKIIVTAESRAAAVQKLYAALRETKISGIETNLAYLTQITQDCTFQSGNVSTRYLNTFSYHPSTIDVLDPGTQSTIQDYPGRIGYWAIGVPPSGPMDHLSFRLANSILGNPEQSPGLEATFNGPTLKFNVDTKIAITGADMQVTLDGKPVAYYLPIDVKAGGTLKMKQVLGPGARAYVAFLGGLEVPRYLGSSATFTLGNFGGHGGRSLRVGDVLHLPVENRNGGEPEVAPAPSVMPEFTNEWTIGVLYGPHGAPDFFTDQDIQTFFSTAWKVHYNSNRTGVRLIGPKPQWARKDGGEAGLHPSNIHDNAYAIGAIDFTGDMPVILGPDGPSLGGFVCPATIIQAELWKLGQLKPGDTVRFASFSAAQANAMEREQDDLILTLDDPIKPRIDIIAAAIDTPILLQTAATAIVPKVVYRQDGDKYMLVEYGPLQLDLNLRFRVHALQTALQKDPPPGIIDLTPGIRSLHIHFDSRILPQQKLLDHLQSAEKQLPDVDQIEVPTRIVHLPLSWDDPATRKAIDIYMKSVRPDAPWCPWNIEFIRRINGLSSVDDVNHIVFRAQWLTLGLGDVYLGAPVATPIDPRHRLVTTKYNPARTWTAENSVGIGGAYLCIYGMEGPGGYQFVGRTCQVWNTYKSTADFSPGKPWLLRFFDQLRFYPVTADELLKFREDFPQGRVKLKIEHETFSLKNYNHFLRQNADSITAFKTKQQKAFEEERDRWIRDGQMNFSTEEADKPIDVGADERLPDGHHAIDTHISGNVWKILVSPGQKVEEGDKLVIVESMKMEIAILSPTAGVVTQVRCAEAKAVTAGQRLIVLKT